MDVVCCFTVHAGAWRGVCGDARVETRGETTRTTERTRNMRRPDGVRAAWACVSDEYVISDQAGAVWRREERWNMRAPSMGAPRGRVHDILKRPYKYQKKT